MQPCIYFFNEDVKFRPPKARDTKAWLARVAEAEKKVIGNLNYVFCSDAFLLQINIDYLGHDTLTDVITFNAGEMPGIVEGEVYISVPRIRDNASAYNVTFHNELLRVMVHGLLHLLGYGDKTTNEKKIMRKKESAYLSLSPIS